MSGIQAIYIESYRQKRYSSLNTGTPLKERMKWLLDTFCEEQEKMIGGKKQ